MWLVTNKAVCIDLVGGMGLMTVKTGRPNTMFHVAMTTGTAYDNIMLAWVGFHFLSFGIIMAYLTFDNILATAVLDTAFHSGKWNVQR